MGRPEKKKSEFDVRLGAVVKSKRVKRDYSRATLSQATGIPEANLKRREAGDNEITVSELRRIAAVLNMPATAMVEEALNDYGGMEKLLDEHTVSDTADTVWSDEIPYIGQADVPEDVAAKKKTPDTKE